MGSLREELEAILRARLGPGASLKVAQLDAVRALQQGRDCLATLPTGFGKSMVYQLPAMWREEMDRPGVTVVVTPLLSLLRDQLRGCEDLDLNAAAWCGTADKRDTERIDRDLRLDADDGGPGIQLLYTTPESLGSNARLRDALRACARNGFLTSIAVDEAHCVASWGHDFRPAYLALRDFRDDVAGPGVPFQALTATATPRVKEQIVSALGLRDPALVATSLNRPNLRYEVFRRESMIGGGHSEVGTGVGMGEGTGVGTEDVALAHLAAMAKETKERWPGSAGIVYARTRAECERLAALLQDKHDVDCEVFHAGRTGEALARTQGNWAGGDLHCVVATVAFGMGVDKADVRFVAHWGPPTTLEGLYQESGRAGRDSKPARCVMYVGSNELDELRKVTGGGGDVEAYARGLECRRIGLLEHFGERRAGGCGEGEEECDVCADPDAVRRAAAAADRISDRAAERRMEDARVSAEEDTHGGTAGSGDWKRRRVEVAVRARRVPLVPTQHRPPVPPGHPLGSRKFVPPMKGTKYRLKQ